MKEPVALRPYDHMTRPGSSVLRLASFVSFCSRAELRLSAWHATHSSAIAVDCRFAKASKIAVGRTNMNKSLNAAIAARPAVFYGKMI